MTKLKVGVIGFGMSANVFHIPLILAIPELSLHAIVQRNATSGGYGDARTKHPDVKVYTTSTALLDDANIDIVIVTTPPDSHFSLALAALEAGKHVVVEKPFVPTSAEAATLDSAAQKHGKSLAVYQNRRWDADFVTVKHLINEGKLGRIVEFESHYDRYKPEKPTTWKGELPLNQGGSILYDLGSHILDQAVSLFGVPRDVTAVFANQRNDGSAEFDSFTLLLSYGADPEFALPLVTVKASILSIETEQPRFWIRGDKGTFRKAYVDIQEDQLKAGFSPLQSGFGVEPVERAGTVTELIDGVPVASKFPNVQTASYLNFYRLFTDSVLKNEPALVPVSAREATDVLRVIEAAQESAKTHKTVKLH